jgi:hypothetical protein
MIADFSRTVLLKPTEKTRVGRSGARSGVSSRIAGLVPRPASFPARGADGLVRGARQRFMYTGP